MPLHPRLVHFPVALLLLGAAALLLYAWRRSPLLREWGFASTLLGWILTLPAIVTGLIEKQALAPGSAADRLADQHTTSIFIMWGLFGLGLYWNYLERKQPGTRSRGWGLLALGLGVIVLVIAGDLGGRLVYELSVGVQP